MKWLLLALLACGPRLVERPPTCGKDSPCTECGCALGECCRAVKGDGGPDAPLWVWCCQPWEPACR